VDDDQHRQCRVTEAAHEQLDTVDHYDGHVAIDLIERQGLTAEILSEIPAGVTP
jgi:hypothetical protein